MDRQSASLEAKVVVLGAQGVGKTSLVVRFVKGSYSNDITSTIGASFMTKKMTTDHCKVRLQIWDTAGQERFRSMAPMYYRGANAALLVYDITSEPSFEDMKSWVLELRKSVESDVVLCVVGNKADLEDARRVPTAVARKYAEEIGALFCETSAKSDNGVEPMFTEVARKLMHSRSMRKSRSVDSLHSLGDEGRQSSPPKGERLTANGDAGAGKRDSDTLPCC
eukprot:Opistho-1_new@26100